MRNYLCTLYKTCVKSTLKNLLTKQISQIKLRVPTTVIPCLERKVGNFVALANLSKGKQQPNTKLEMVSDISFGCLRKKDVKVVTTVSYQQMEGRNP